MTLSKRHLWILVIIVGLLLIPLIAMQFTQEVNWDIIDFIVAGILLFLTGFTIDLILNKMRNKKQRILVIAIVILILLLIWVELAVGILGSPFAGS